MATTNSSIVTTIYGELAGGLAPPASDLATYTALLTGGGWTQAQVATAIEAEPFIQTVVNPIIREYQAAFGRVPDQAGLTFWIKIAAPNGAGGATNTSFLSTLSTTFANSPEFLARYGVTATTPVNASVITSLYTNVLGRGPDQPGLTFWLNSGLNVSQLLQAFAQSNEFIFDTNSPIIAFENAEATGTPVTTGSLLALSSAIVNVGLTTGVDTFNLTAGNQQVNGTANGAGATFNAGDSINGNSLPGNSLVINDLAVAVPGGATWTPTSLAGTTVTGVPTATFNGSNAVTANTTGYTGLVNLNITSADSAASVDNVTAAATTAVKITDSVQAVVTAGMSVTGGSSVTISEANSTFDNSAQTILVTGGSGTSAVSVTQTVGTGGKTQLVSIQDTNAGSATKAGVITTVTIDGLTNAGTATINTNSLSSLTVNNVKSGTVSITPSAAYAALQLNTTLGLTVTNNAALTLNDTVTDYTTLNITAGAKASVLTYTGGWNGVVTETITGATGASSVTQTGTGLTALKTVTVSGAASLFDAALNGASVKTVTATGTGNVAVAIDDTKATFVGTAATGGEIVTITSDATKAVTGNGLANSEVVFNNTAATFTTGNTGTNVTGFKVLGLAGASQGPYSLAAAPFAGFTAIDVQATAAATTLTGVTAGTALSIDTAPTGVLTYQTADSTGSADSVAINLGVSTAQAAISGLTATAGGLTFASNLALNDSTGAGIGTVSFTSNDSSATATTTLAALLDSKLSSLSVAGSDAISITAATTTSAAGLTVTDNHTGTATSSYGFTDTSLTSLTLAGTAKVTLASVGAGAQASLTVTNNDTQATATTITTLTDTALSTLNLAGTGGIVTIGTLAGDTSNLLTINDTHTATAANVISALSDTSLTTFSLTGTGADTYSAVTSGALLTLLDTNTGAQTITSLTGVTSLVAQNNSTGTLTITDVSASESTITLLNNIGYTNVSLTTAGGVNVSGSSDNSTVAITTSAAVVGATAVTLGNGNDTVNLGGVATTAAQTVTLGNGNNTVTTANHTFAGTDTIAVGNGNNTITSGAATAGSFDLIKVGSGANSITLAAAHAQVENITFTAANGGSTSVFTSITNALTGDTLTWKTAAVNTTVTHEGAATSIAAGVAGIATASGYSDFTFSGNTYIYENTGSAATSELVALIGTVAHTVNTATTGVATLA